jgi:PAP2 superfamily
MRARPSTISLLRPSTPGRLGWAVATSPGLALPRRGEAHPSPHRGRRLVRFAAVELAVWGALYGAYLAVRGLTIGSPEDALGHASDVVRLEQAVGVFREPAVQEALGSGAGFFAAYYMLGFAPLIGVVALWLALRRVDVYRDLRNALLLSIAIATVVFVLFPTAPPRLVGGLGIDDTVGLSGHDSGSFLGVPFNPYAAVPSMHVGWSLLVALYGFRAARSRALRGFFLVHPLLMAVTVTATGNHYFLDAVAGLAVACLALTVLRGREALSVSLPSFRLPALTAAAPAPVPLDLERRSA